MPESLEKLIKIIIELPLYLRIILIIFTLYVFVLGIKELIKKILISFPAKLITIFIVGIMAYVAYIYCFN